ncbi:hypothetical protein T440DRAFT_471564 [Plenodomus tracheiphilus IPT5]|uniref:BZIP domain-containing protein n=1 Tax=Plenodomus tracheiphilus IPT5 TaxID=1408161 RepID=A0A6A7AVP3_9PLEO|nr:hypothetical protein T440DRAFT_471564 [Plenodomus tracheiphilus IPT5]
MKFTFKPYKASKGSPQDSQQDTTTPQQKRKEQIRRAQRTHRERKEAYTASLEAEVIQLRANEARILQETKALYAEVGFLKGLLTTAGVS